MQAIGLPRARTLYTPHLEIEFLFVDLVSGREYILRLLIAGDNVQAKRRSTMLLQAIKDAFDAWAAGEITAEEAMRRIDHALSALHP